MELEELTLWADAFTAFCARFEDLFVRSESRAQMQKYLRGLVAPLERKTTWQLAELVQDTTPDRMQRLLYRVPWDAEAARDRLDRLEQFVSERFGEADGIGVLDETGIPKKGTSSVGVANQYGGAVSKLANCQVATVLTYVDLCESPWPCLPGPPLVSARSLVSEPPASSASVVCGPIFPRVSVFTRNPSRPLLCWTAMLDCYAGLLCWTAMLEHAWEIGVPMRWVTGDCIYGESTPLRQAIERAGKWSVLAVRSVTRVWRARPAVLAPTDVTGGRPRRAVRLAPGAPKAERVAAVIAQLPRQRWRRLRVGAGAKGAREPRGRGSMTGPACE